MKEDKKINSASLDKVNGGFINGSEYYTCPHCRHDFVTPEEDKYVDEGCTGHYEYKCPQCHEWFEV